MSDKTISQRTNQVLVLEDDLRDRQLLEAVLEVAGVHCEFTHATTRSEYETALMDGTFDLIISDFSLPNYDGLSARAAAREACANTPFLFISGATDPERTTVALQNGADDCVHKDRPDLVVMAVKQALRKNKWPENKSPDTSRMQATPSNRG